MQMSGQKRVAMKVVTSRPQRLQPDASMIKQPGVGLSSHDVNKRFSGFLITSAPSRPKAGPKSVGASVSISSHNGRLAWVASELGSAPAAWEIHGARVHWGQFLTMLWFLSLAKRAVRMVLLHTHATTSIVLLRKSREAPPEKDRAPQLGQGVCRAQDELHGLA